MQREQALTDDDKKISLGIYEVSWEKLKRIVKYWFFSHFLRYVLVGWCYIRTPPLKRMKVCFRPVCRLFDRYKRGDKVCTRLVRLAVRTGQRVSVGCKEVALEEVLRPGAHGTYFLWKRATSRSLKTE